MAEEKTVNIGNTDGSRFWVNAKDRKPSHNRYCVVMVQYGTDDDGISLQFAEYANGSWFDSNINITEYVRWWIDIPDELNNTEE